MGPETRVITLLTDFGTQDYFVGAMKGVILSKNPDAQIVDLTHDIPPQDIESAAFNLLACYRNFPAGTIHLAVVDPGVGSDRRPLIVQCAGQLFVGPDNGLFSWVCERAERWRAVQATNAEFFHHPVSHTFHGRDIFAPIAANLSLGRGLDEFGPFLADIVWLESLAPAKLDDYTIQGRVVHIDRFGNCVTNVTKAVLSSAGPAAWRVAIGELEVSSFHSFFAEASAGEIFCTSGSAGFLEISLRNASAAKLLNIERGQPVIFRASILTEVTPRTS